jgi:hypothetical protein
MAATRARRIAGALNWCRRRADAARQRQVAVVPGARAAVGEQGLQRLEDELRVAAGVPRDRRGQRRRRDARQLERRKQLLDVAQRQRCELDLDQAVAVAQGRREDGQGRLAFLGARGQDQARRFGDAADPRQQLDAGDVGEMEIVDDRDGDRRPRSRQHALDRTLEGSAIELRRRGMAALGNDPRQFGARFRRRLHAEREHRAQQTCDDRERAVHVARPRPHLHRGVLLRELLEEAALAHAGIAEDDRVRP